MTTIAGGIITLEYAATGMNYAPATVGTGPYAARDADLIAYVQAATPIIEDIAGPVLPGSRSQKFDGGETAILLPFVASSVTSVYEGNNATPLVQGTDYRFDPFANQIVGGGFNYLRMFMPGTLSINITYAVGFSPIPMNLQLGTRELVRFWVEQGNQAQRPAYGDQVESMAWTPQGFAVPKRVIQLCAPNRKLGGFA